MSSEAEVEDGRTEKAARSLAHRDDERLVQHEAMQWWTGGYAVYI